MSMATTTLDDIIDELRLKYDSSVGLLDGKAIREIPNLNTLYNLTKLLGNLGKNLKEAEERDQALLDKVEAKINEGQKEEEKQDDEDDEVEDESIPLAKRRKVDGSKSKPESKEDVDMGEEKEESEDEDEGELKDANDKFEDDEKQEIEKAASPAPEEAERINSKDDPIPPEQRGSYTHENDTRLKNPKSEFVPSQTLSADAIAELGLFSEDNNGLDTQGKEYLKRKYGVASYPEHDLKDLLPGEIPNTDFSKHKAPSNQVQFTTYQSYIESFFRPFSNDDIHFANEKYVLPPGFEKGDYDPATSPYLIPKLGPFYADVWAEEDVNLRSKLSSPAPQKPPLESYKPKGTVDDVSDEKLLTEDVSVGPLSSRLLSAILSIHEAKGDNSRDDDEESIKSEDNRSEANLPLDDDVATQLDSDAYRVTSEVNDFYSMEERLKRELKYIGIFMNLPTRGEKAKRGGSIIDSDEWLLHKEDDEVSAEIRVLQEELKGAVARNRQRKKVLVPILEEQLAYQEYCTILEDLDNQVNTAYTKRLKAKSRKKKTPEGTVNVAQQQAANSGLRALMEKRRRWIESIGSLFKPPQLMKRVPSESIFKDQVHSDDEEGDAEVDVVNEEESVG